MAKEVSFRVCFQPIENVSRKWAKEHLGRWAVAATTEEISAHFRATVQAHQDGREDFDPLEPKDNRLKASLAALVLVSGIPAGTKSPEMAAYLEWSTPKTLRRRMAETVRLLNKLGAAGVPFRERGAAFREEFIRENYVLAHLLGFALCAGSVGHVERIRSIPEDTEPSGAMPQSKAARIALKVPARLLEQGRSFSRSAWDRWESAMLALPAQQRAWIKRSLTEGGLGVGVGHSALTNAWQSAYMSAPWSTDYSVLDTREHPRMVVGRDIHLEDTLQQSLVQEKVPGPPGFIRVTVNVNSDAIVSGQMWLSNRQLVHPKYRQIISDACALLGQRIRRREREATTTDILVRYTGPGASFQAISRGELDPKDVRAVIYATRAFDADAGTPDECTLQPVHQPELHFVGAQNAGTCSIAQTLLVGRQGSLADPMRMYVRIKSEKDPGAGMYAWRRVDANEVQLGLGYTPDFWQASSVKPGRISEVYVEKAKMDITRTGWTLRVNGLYHVRVTENSPKVEVGSTIAIEMTPMKANSDGAPLYVLSRKHRDED